MAQKYKRTEETTMNNGTPTNWATQKMDTFLETYNLPRMNHEETENR